MVARSNQNCKSPAHFVAEDIVAEKVENDLFRIFLEPSTKISVSSSEYDVRNSFTVHYPVAADGRELDEKLVRIYIAHELGHLYVHILLNSQNFDSSTLDKNETTEILSTHYGRASRQAGFLLERAA